MSFRLFLSFSLVSLVACGDVDEPLPHEADTGSISTDDAGVVDDRGLVLASFDLNALRHTRCLSLRLLLLCRGGALIPAAL